MLHPRRGSKCAPPVALAHHLAGAAHGLIEIVLIDRRVGDYWAGAALAGSSTICWVYCTQGHFGTEQATEMERCSTRGCPQPMQRWRLPS